jgi:hypothetical protein
VTPQDNKTNPSPEPENKPEKLSVPEILKKPNFQPPKFKYVPPKAGKRHF